MIGANKIQIRTQRTATGSGCVNGAVNTVMWSIVAQPVGPTVAIQTPTNATICTGTTVSATFNAGSGGTGCSDDYIVIIDGGSPAAYTPGSSVGGAATTSIVIKGRRASCASGSGCNGTSYVTLASWAVVPQPVAPTLNTKTPDVTTVCAGTLVKASANAGSGGTGCSDSYQYSKDNGTTWYAYTPGTDINTAVSSGSVIIQAQRGSCTAGAGCNGTGWVTIASWNINQLPVFTAPVSTTLPDVQYSDPVNTTITVTDDGAGSALTASTQWKLGAGSFTSGLPANLTLIVASTGAYSRTWTLGGIANVAPGVYTIRVTVADVLCSSYVDLSLTVTKENACGSYNGTLFVNTPSLSNTSAAIHLEIAVTEEADGSAGSLANATVVFSISDGGASAKTATATYDVANSTPSTAIFYYDTTVNLGNALCRTLDVSWVIGGYYTNTNCPEQLTQVTIAVPADDFSAGGGYIILTNNAYGPNVGGLGLATGKNNWGYNVKWNKSLTNLQGNFNTIIRKNGRTYQVKSNKPTFLKITLLQAATTTTPAKRKAEITYGNATLKDVTDIVNGVCVNPSGCWGDGNATIYLTVEDNGEPGSTGATLDRIGFGIKDKNNVLWYSTNIWSNPSSSAALQNIDGGNIQIRQAASSGGPQKTTNVNAEITQDKPAEVLPFNVKAYPNPTEHQFTLYLEGASNKKVQIVVYDAVGRQVKKIERGDASGAIKFGEDLKVGAYFVEVRQGVNRKTLKLVKQ
jgi:hypothetical protein